MKTSAKSNIFTYTRDAIWECYGAFLQGDRDAVVCVIGATPLSDVARLALERSFERLEYGESPCVFVSLAGMVAPQTDVVSQAGAVSQTDAAAPQVGELASQANALVSRMSAQDLFTVVEGLDPVVVVAADATSAELLGRAYRAGFNGLRPAKLLGRRALAFTSFESMLCSSTEKQRAWAALKQLAL